jgi:hypothetical protein
MKGNEMSPPDDIFAKLFDWAWAAVLALGSLVWKGQNEKIVRLTEETDRNREIAAKIFDKLETMSKDNANRFERLSDIIHSGLERKADR